jgi:hypothetical protein
VAVVRILQTGPIAGPAVDEAGQQLAVPAANAVITASAGGSNKPLTRPEAFYIAIIVGALVLGAGVGVWLDDGKRVYTPPDGVSVFALFYIAAQTIERLLEPLSHFYASTKPAGNQPARYPPPTASAQSSIVAKLRTRITKSVAVTKRDEALAAGDAPAAAWWQEMVDQVRSNTTSLWAIASAIGMVLSGWLGLLLLNAVKAPNAPRPLDIIVTGIVIGAGTKPVHDLISNIQKAKEAKEDGTVSGTK